MQELLKSIFLLASPAGCEPAREEVLASQRPNALPTELSGRPKINIEKVQNRAARFVTRNYVYHLEYSEWHPWTIIMGVL